MTGTVAVLGAGGGIGAALATEAEARGHRVVRLSRPVTADTARLAEAAAAMPDDLSHVIVAIGLLHEGGRGPERGWAGLDAVHMAHVYQVNAILPALAAQALMPRLVRSSAPRPLFAVLTARVGSIADNRLGGWHSYRMAKAAANQLVRTLSIEMTRRRPDSVVAALHPGTVDTAMSAPFQRNLPDHQLNTPAEAARALWAVMDGLRPDQTGSFHDWKGQPVPW